MALAANETWRAGFVVTTTTDPPAPATTTSLVGAAMSDGYLRDPDGRLVVTLV